MGWTMPCHPVHRFGWRGRGLFLVALVACLLVPVASASANAFEAVQQAYASSPSETVPPCKFSSAELAQAQSEIPNDDQQYGQNLIAAIQLARQQQANGACRAKKHQKAAAATPVGTPVPPSAAPLGPATPLHVGSATAATDSGPPAPILILAILGALVAVAGASLGIARLSGWDPGWVRRSSHSWGEARYRASGIWSEFGDWMRGIPH
jgi:hypothetical protein